jgi:hypothetical protein
MLSTSRLVWLKKHSAKNSLLSHYPKKSELSKIRLM